MRRFLIAAAFAALLTPSVALADDFTFTVPVRVENVRASPTMRVFCDVYGVDAHGAPRHITHFGAVDVTPVGGAYHGNVTVVANLLDGERRDEARTWECSMTYYYRSPSAGMMMISGADDADRNGQYTHFTGQEISASRLFARGAFPAH